MKLANKVCMGALTTLLLVFTVAGQGLSDKDTRNTAPAVGTGGVAGGPTGLFTVFDQQTLRKSEFTFSIAYSNYDRDPGDADFTSVPLSFNYGLTNRIELYGGTEAWRGVKINSPNNLSAFYLPNSTLIFNGTRTTAPAIVLAPGTGGAFFNTAVFRPAGSRAVYFRSRYARPVALARRRRISSVLSSASRPVRIRPSVRRGRVAVRQISRV